MLTKSEFMKGLIVLTLALAAATAHAWQPKGTVNFILPNGPGAGNEIGFRFLASIVEQNNPGIKFQPQHIPGADGTIATNHLFTKTATDGQTVAVPACQSAWVTPEIWYNSKHDMMQAVHVTHIARSPLAFWAHPSSKINTPKELVDAIRKKDRQINIAIGGAGHKLAVEYLTTSLKVAGGDMVETPMYKGPAQALLDVMGGHAEFGVTPVTVGYPHVQSGKLKLIGIANDFPLAGLEKSPLMKDLVPGLSIHGCWNIVLPPGTDPEIAKWYREQFNAAIKHPEVQEKFKENFMFATPEWQTEQGLKNGMIALRRVWQPVAQRIKPEN
jgi:tripartite-type tricarboxylate transporter receptor subunit TctC